MDWFRYSGYRLCSAVISALKIIAGEIALTDAIVSQSPDGWLIHFSRGSDISATLNISADDQGRLLLELQNDNLNHNRIWLRLAAQPEDHIYGCGEQFSYFDLRGKPFPLWTSEQGVGRNKQTYVTWQADCKENAGGDYYWTFFPQPTFVSTQKYYCHVDNSCYMNFDFSAPEYHELALWEDKATLRFECADTYISLLEKLTALLGRQPELPDWIYDGVTLGIQGGTEVCQKKLDTMRNAGVKVNGIWAQDWSGIRMTSFGKRECGTGSGTAKTTRNWIHVSSSGTKRAYSSLPISTRMLPAIKTSAKKRQSAAIWQRCRRRRLSGGVWRVLRRRCRSH